MQWIFQDFLSIQQPLVLARHGGGSRKEVDHGISNALELSYRGLPSSRWPPSLGGWVFLSLHSLSWHLRPQNEADGRKGKPTETETKGLELILYSGPDVDLKTVTLPL